MLFGKHNEYDGLLSAVKGVLANEKAGEAEIKQPEPTPEVDTIAVSATAQYLEEKKKKKKSLDDVDPEELEGKFKERDDKDVDNDGDEDESDRYLHKRRKAIGKKKASKGEKIEINPEVEESDNSRIIKTIRSMVTRSFNEGVTKTPELNVDTPGQEGTIEPALDYEKYNSANPVVSNDELDSMLDKGSEFYKEQQDYVKKAWADKQKKKEDKAWADRNKRPAGAHKHTGKSWGK
jgi:hypothetical protein